MIQRRSSVSRYGRVALYEGLFPLPLVAASRTVSYEADVEVAAANAAIHLRSVPGFRTDRPSSS